MLTYADKRRRIRIAPKVLCPRWFVCVRIAPLQSAELQPKSPIAEQENLFSILQSEIHNPQSAIEP
jgi:hypothetical protein